MTAPDAKYAVVLAGHQPGRSQAVAQALARVFDQEESWALGVVHSVPVVLASALTETQAAGVVAALAEVESAGGRLQVLSGTDPQMAVLEWPEPPLIHGRSLETYGNALYAGAPGGADLVCPHCGRPIQVRLAAPLGAGTPAEARPATGLPRHVAAPVRLPPIPVPKAVDSGWQPKAAVAAPAISAPAGDARAAEAAAVWPGTPTPVTVPAAASAPAAGGGVPPATAGTPSQLTDQRTPVVPLLPVADAAPGTPAPLPEVPVMEGAQGESTRPTRPVATAMAMDPRFAGPMDLATFEAGLKRDTPAEPAPSAPPAPPSSEPSTAPAADSPAAPATPLPAEPRRTGITNILRNSANDPEARCSLFLGKTNNALVHALIAELQGIPVEEAQVLCQRLVVPVAKDITVQEAEEIRARFQPLNVRPRLVLKQR